MDDTIFALSSGSPPAAIAVIRISGPNSSAALITLVGKLPVERRPVLSRLHDAAGLLLDEALVLWLPGPANATGEDLAELHCHGGRAVVAAVERCLEQLPGLRAAEPGEFTRRAFSNGRIDLSEAEGLADLLSAETELQRSAAVAMAGGNFSREVENWRATVLTLSAQVEAALDFSDEDDVSEMPADFHSRMGDLQGDLQSWLDRPRSERLAEGFRVVLAGPPNSGKSTLFNALIENEAAITSPIAGTTRDVLERSVAVKGVPFTFIDTAGLREGSEDSIEQIGIAKAREQFGRADLVLWLGPEGEGPKGSWELEAKIDTIDAMFKSTPDHRVSAQTGENLDELKAALVSFASLALPKPGEAALNSRQAAVISAAASALADAKSIHDPLILAEHLRQARRAFDRITGRTTTEDMLDTLFGKFCIGK